MQFIRLLHEAGRAFCLKKFFDLGRTVSRYRHSLKGDRHVGIMERIERMDRIIVVQHLRGLCDVHRTSHRL